MVTGHVLWGAVENPDQSVVGQASGLSTVHPVWGRAPACQRDKVAANGRGPQRAQDVRRSSMSSIRLQPCLFQELADRKAGAIRHSALDRRPALRSAISWKAPHFIKLHQPGPILLLHPLLFIGSAYRPVIAMLARIFGRRGGQESPVDRSLDRMQHFPQRLALIRRNADVDALEPTALRTVEQPPAFDPLPPQFLRR